MDALKKYLTEEYNKNFEGWDFSHLNGRLVENLFPWKYENIIQKYIPRKNVLLDMETGGGEFLSSLTNLPQKVFATEAYKPNIPVAEKRFKEKNIILKTIERDGEIPFENDYFDIIINRHGSYDVDEIKRALKKDGTFITQQVGGLNAIDLNMAFETETMGYNYWCLVKNMELFGNAGMEIIESNELIGKSRFYDIGAIVYYLKCVPWQIKDFSIEKYYNKLKTINWVIEKNGFIDFINHRFYVVASKR